MWSERHTSNESQSRNPSNLDAPCQIIADISLRCFGGMYLMLILLKRPSNIKAVRHQSECWSLPGGKFPCCIIKSVFFFPTFLHQFNLHYFFIFIYLWVSTSSSFIVTAQTVRSIQTFSSLCTSSPSLTPLFLDVCHSSYLSPSRSSHERKVYLIRHLAQLFLLWDVKTVEPCLRSHEWGY